MRGLSFALLVIAVSPTASAPPRPAVVDIALSDQDGAIYVAPALTLGSGRELRPHAGDVNGDGIVDIVTAHPHSRWAGTDLRGLAWVALGPVLGSERDLVATSGSGPSLRITVVPSD